MLRYTSMNSKQNNDYKMNQSAHTLKKYIKKHTTQHNQKKIFFLQKRDKKISNKNTNHNKNKKNKRKNNKQKKICFD